MRRGFTLIELMVVVLIVAILGALGLVAYGNAVKSARDGKRAADIEAVRQALLLYRTENGCYPDATTFGGLSGRLVPTYLSTLPADPQDPTRAYGYTRGATPVTCQGGLSGRTSFSLTYWSESDGATITVNNP